MYSIYFENEHYLDVDTLEDAEKCLNNLINVTAAKYGITRERVRECFSYRIMKNGKEVLRFRIKGSTLIIVASCLKDAIRKLVDAEDFTYTRHWYNASNRKSWASVETGYGYKCIVEEL